jgi:hypothetical protein
MTVFRIQIPILYGAVLDEVVYVIRNKIYKEINHMILNWNSSKIQALKLLPPARPSLIIKHHYEVGRRNGTHYVSQTGVVEESFVRAI